MRRNGCVASSCRGPLLAAFLLACGSACAIAQSDRRNRRRPVLRTRATQRSSSSGRSSQPLNNQPVWSGGALGRAADHEVPGRETNILIQPEGQTWRALRNSMVSVYAGWALVAMVLVIAAFHFWKGTLQLHEPPTGRRIRRFTNWQMAIHWTTAYTFLILAFSGLIMTFGKNLLLPLIGYTLFSWLSILAKNLHNFVGPLFFICIVLLFFTFVRDNVWRSTTGTGSAISAGSSRGTTCRRASSTPARRRGSGAACWSAG